MGVNYRRSPIMTIGRDVYVDSRLMIAKLEERFPPSAAHPGLSSPETQGVAALLRNFVVDNMFVAAVRNFPPGECGVVMVHELWQSLVFHEKSQDA